MATQNRVLDRELLQAAINATNDGVVIADAGQADTPLIYVNPAFCQITGHSFDEAVGRNCRFLQGEEQTQPGLITLRKAITNAQACRVVLHNFKKDGTPFWNELHIAPLGEQGDPRFFIGVQTDVTKRVEAQDRSAQLQRSLESQNHQLAELNKTKNELLGMAAHDLRNPLSSIVLTASTLQRNPLDREQQQVQLARIRDSADFMLALIDGLLDVSQIESGHMNLRAERASLLELLVGTVGLHRHRAEEKKIELTLNITTTDAVEMTIDRHKIRQVLDNMISNALKYSPEGTIVCVSMESDENEVRVHVSDTGQGIALEDLERIFMPFGRASNTSTTGGERSTGLGLAICQRITEAHGGKMTVKSRIDKGSTFTMHIPLHH